MKKYRKPHRFKKRKPLYRNRLFWLGILILIFLCAVFYFFFICDFFQVKKVNISGELGEVPKERLFSFFPTKNIFLLSLNEIEKNILKEFPEIAEIKINRNFPDEINTLIEKRKIIAVFCTAEEECFALDKEGVIFKKEKEEKETFPVVKDPNFNDGVKLGQEVIDKDKLFLILEINSQLENFNIGVKEFVIFSQEKLTVLTEEEWDIYFSLQEDVIWQLAKLEALLKQKIDEEKRKDLEYIELRFGNFANPKYRN